MRKVLAKAIRNAKMAASGQTGRTPSEPEKNAMKNAVIA